MGAQEWSPDAILPGPSVAHNAVSFEEESMLILVGSDWFGGAQPFLMSKTPKHRSSLVGRVNGDTSTTPKP